VRLGALTLLLATLAIAATASRTAAHPTAAAACGSAYRLLKTLSDPLRKKVNLTPMDTTLVDIATPTHPHSTPMTRDTPFERQVWRVTAQITEFKREGDSDIHLILFDAGTYGIAEMPAAACVPKKAGARRAIIAVRKKFEAACGKATNTWQQLGATATITGVGFWDKPHTQNPHAPNFAELHPVTAIKFISGCGA
jgi:hypothetical protein